MNVELLEPEIRHIEDIIDMQKANGNFHVRQVAFDLPSKTDSNISTSVVKSLESGLSKLDNKKNKKKNKNQRHKRNKFPSTDLESWPSDSDITVLRMKLYLRPVVKEDVENAIAGDGLHQPDSSSMVNLATVMLHSRSPSKHSLNVEEYLLPINSWGKETIKLDPTDAVDLKKQTYSNATCFDQNFTTCTYMTSDHSARDNIYLSENDSSHEIHVKSKVARFLRLYFCPCCTCLYKLENKLDNPSEYFTRNKSHSND